MKNLALITAILSHPVGGVRDAAAAAIKAGRFHFGPAAERTVFSGQIWAHRFTGDGPGESRTNRLQGARMAGVDVYLMTAGYPVGQDNNGCDVYTDWCFAILGISRRRFFAPLRRLRAVMVAQGNGADAAWALVRASQAASVGYHGFPDCHGVSALVNGVGVAATTITTQRGVSVSLSLGVPPAVGAGFCRHEDGDGDETLPIASHRRGVKRHPVTNPNRCARRRLAPR